MESEARVQRINTSRRGDLLILLNATSYGVYLVLVKPLMSIYKPTTVVAWVFLFGALVVLPIGMPQAPWLFHGSEILRPISIYSVAFVVVFTTFVVYLLNIFAMREFMPTVVSRVHLSSTLPCFRQGLFAYSIYAAGDDDWQATSRPARRHLRR